MKTKDEIIKEVSHHAFIEIISYGIMDYVKQAMTNYAEQQNKKMHETLKEVQSDINIVGQVSKKTLEKIESLLKELKS